MATNSLQDLKLKHVPRAFRGWAKRHNALVDELIPLVNLEAGKGIRIAKSSVNIKITNTEA